MNAVERDRFRQQQQAQQQTGVAPIQAKQPHLQNLSATGTNKGNKQSKPSTNTQQNTQAPTRNTTQ